MWCVRWFTPLADDRHYLALSFLRYALSSTNFCCVTLLPQALKSSKALVLLRSDFLMNDLCLPFMRPRLVNQERLPSNTWSMLLVSRESCQQSTSRIADSQNPWWIWPPGDTGEVVVDMRQEQIERMHLGSKHSQASSCNQQWNTFDLEIT